MKLNSSKMKMGDNTLITLIILNYNFHNLPKSNPGVVQFYIIKYVTNVTLILQSQFSITNVEQ